MCDIDPFCADADTKYLLNSEETLHGTLFLIFILITCIIVLIPVFLLIMIVDSWNKFRKLKY